MATGRAPSGRRRKQTKMCTDFGMLLSFVLIVAVIIAFFGMIRNIEGDAAMGVPALRGSLQFARLISTALPSQAPELSYSLPQKYTIIQISEAAAKAATAALVAELAAVLDPGEAALEDEQKSTPIVWRKESGKSCQGYVETGAPERSLEESKKACDGNEACAAVVCPHGANTRCTLRGVDNLVPYPPEDCYTRQDGYVLHPAVNEIIDKKLCFRGVGNQRGRRVNILIVQRPFATPEERQLFEQYKNQILFLGISSFEDYPFYSGNPFTPPFSPEEYLGMFPGFLHMMREPKKSFPPHVKTLLMSQSDFLLPDYPARDYSVPRKYDFTLSGSDQDVANDCVGWSSFAKNWSFVKEALGVMCGEYGLTGVLAATKSKDGKKACTLPDSCSGKMIQTVFLSQDEYLNYLKQSRFAFLPQIHDASPRVATQALALDVPMLMNAHISGGWKYMNEKTGEFFTDMSDFRQSLEKILRGADVPNYYEPRKWVKQYYGNEHSGKRLFKFVEESFADRVELPVGTKLLITQSDR